MLRNDVIVVGAGPAGIFAAKKAAELGAEVTIFEEHTEVGIPSHCTGHISLNGLHRLDLNLPKNVIENRITSAVFHSPSGYQFSMSYPTPVSCVVNRRLFDQKLLESAMKAGAEISTGVLVTSFLIKNGQVVGVSLKGEQKRVLPSRIVIDDEGVSSTLLKRAGFETLDPCRTVNAVQAEVDGIQNVDEPTVELFFGRNTAPGFYAWIVPLGDGSGKVGLGTAKGNPRDLLLRFIQKNPEAKHKLKNSKIRNLTSHPIPLGGGRVKTFYPGLLIVGDAASHVKPTTGGGIIMGLTAAEIAGEIAVSAVKGEDSSAWVLSEYERRWKQEIGFELTIMNYLRRMFDSLVDQQLDTLFRYCRLLGLNKALKNERELDFQGTTLIRLVKNPRALLALSYMLLTALPTIMSSQGHSYNDGGIGK
jgi:digeranylgeranylglycerophospholipid reductase